MNKVFVKIVLVNYHTIEYFVFPWYTSYRPIGERGPEGGRGMPGMPGSSGGPGKAGPPGGN